MSVINIDLKLAELGQNIESVGTETQRTIQTLVDGIAYQAFDKAIQLANQNLRSTRADYIGALNFKKLDNNIYIITLEGKHANAVEDGYDSFDQKPGLLNGPNAKITEKGTKFNTIPYGFKPQSKVSMSPKMTNMRDAVNVLIKERGLNKIIKQNGKPRQGVVARIKNTGIKDLEGLVKIQKQYQRTVQSTYMTFRRVSSNSDPSKWIHPGFKGAHIFPMVEAFIERELDRAFAQMF